MTLTENVPFRLGLPGSADRIAGTTEDGLSAELRCAGSGWEFLVEGERVEAFESADAAIEVIPKHGFIYTTAIVTARIADLLFQGAVEQAEDAVGFYWRSLAITVRSNARVREMLEPNLLQAILALPLDDPIDFTLATSFLDRSLRRSMNGREQP